MRAKAPSGTLRFHARLTEEAIDLDDRAEPLELTGHRSDGRPETCTVFVPHPFTYLIMKLFAFEDQKDNWQSDAGRHHAMDLYRIVAMMTEPQYVASRELSQAHQDDPRLHKARGIVAEHFSSRSSLGTLRLREHPLFDEDFPLDDFCAVLREVLSPPTVS